MKAQANYKGMLYNGTAYGCGALMVGTTAFLVLSVPPPAALLAPLAPGGFLLGCGVWFWGSRAGKADAPQSKADL